MKYEFNLIFRPENMYEIEKQQEALLIEGQVNLDIQKNYKTKIPKKNKSM